MCTINVVFIPINTMPINLSVTVTFSSYPFSSTAGVSRKISSGMGHSENLEKILLFFFIYELKSSKHNYKENLDLAN